MRSRFLEKVDASKALSSIVSPVPNQCLPSTSQAVNCSSLARATNFSVSARTIANSEQGIRYRKRAMPSYSAFPS